MTNSPPSNVNDACCLEPNEPARVLAGGIDRLDLSLSIRWASGAWVDELAKAKEIAKLTKERCPITVDTPEGLAAFGVAPSGSEGHERVLSNQSYHLSIGNWLEPKQRPSMSLAVRSETLWHVGVPEAVARIVGMIEALGGVVESI